MCLYSPRHMNFHGNMERREKSILPGGGKENDCESCTEKPDDSGEPDDGTELPLHEKLSSAWKLL